MFDKIELSASSIISNNFEYLNTPSNWFNANIVVVIAVVIKVLIAVDVLLQTIVIMVDVNNTLVVSGSTIAIYR